MAHGCDLVSLLVCRPTMIGLPHTTASLPLPTAVLSPVRVADAHRAGSFREEAALPFAISRRA